MNSLGNFHRNGKLMSCFYEEKLKLLVSAKIIFWMKATLTYSLKEFKELYDYTVMPLILTKKDDLVEDGVIMSQS